MDVRKLLATVVGMAGLLAFVIVSYNRTEDRKEVLADHSFTHGRVIQYSSTGSMRHKTVTYEYSVGYKTYTRVIDLNFDFSGCGEDMAICSQRRFHVMYSNKNPEKSLIDLRNEVDLLRAMVGPEGIDDFR